MEDSASRYDDTSHDKSVLSTVCFFFVFLYFQDTRIVKSSEPQCVELSNRSEAYLLSFSSDDERRYVTSLLRAHVYELSKKPFKKNKLFSR